MSKTTEIAGVLALTALLAACAGSQTTADANQVSSSGMEPVTDLEETKPRLDPDAVRGKVYAKTGTRISSKVCKTNREWEQAARDSRKATEDIQRGGVMGGDGRGG